VLDADAPSFAAGALAADEDVAPGVEAEVAGTRFDEDGRGPVERPALDDGSRRPVAWTSNQPPVCAVSSRQRSRTATASGVGPPLMALSAR
jgi:hypothetical protein